MREKFKKKFYEFKKLLFHRNTALLVLAEPLKLYTNARSAAFAAQNCSEHPFYCFTGIPHLSCSQNPSSYTPMPHPQLLRSKTAASTCFTVSPVFQRQGARRPPRYTPMPIPQLLRKQNCSEHSFYCFTGIPHSLCSQNPSSSTQMPVPQLLNRKTAASTRFTVSPEYRTFRARIPRTPQVAKSMLR